MIKKSRERSAVAFYNKEIKEKNKLGKKTRINKIAPIFNIKAKRLGQIIKDPSKIGAKSGAPTRLTILEENTLITWIEQRCVARMYTHKDLVVKKGNEILKLRSLFGYGHLNKKGPLSQYWYYSFLERHQNKLGVRKLQALEQSRVKGCNTRAVLEYFVFVRDLMEKHKFRQDKIFNCDETPLELDNIASKGIWSKAIKNAHIVNSGNRQVLTLFPCVSSNGDSIPPLIIYEGKTIDSGYYDYDFNFWLSSNDTAYMTKEIFRYWVNHFVSFVNPTAELPVLLILDNFQGHLDIEALKYMQQNHVFLCGLPPHTSHISQPLDLTVFSHLKTRYKAKYNEYMQQYNMS